MTDHQNLPTSDVDILPGRLDAAGGSHPETQEQAVARAETGSPAERALALEMTAHAATLPMTETVDDPGHPNCQRCEVLPPALTGAGTLHLNLPHTHTLGKVLSHLVRGGSLFTRQGGVVSVEVNTGGLGGLIGPVADLMSATERRDTRAFFQPNGTAADLNAAFQIDKLDTFAARVGSEWLLDLMRQDRLVSHYQPILTADGQEVYGYECLLRGEAADGRTVPAGAIFDAGRRADLLFQLDLAARRAALRGAAHHNIQARLFVNFAPNAIYDPEFCLDSTVRLCDELGLSPGRVVFEMVESEKLPDMAHLKAIVGYYRRHGFEVAVDDLGAGYSSLQLLLALRPDYVKLDMSLTRGVDRDPGKAVLAAKLLEAAQDLRLSTVAEGIETRGEWAWVRDHGINFVQGFLFAKPAVPPPVPAAVAG